MYYEISICTPPCFNVAIPVSDGVFYSLNDMMTLPVGDDEEDQEDEEVDGGDEEEE